MSLIGIIASQNYPRGVTVDYLVVAGGGAGGSSDAPRIRAVAAVAVQVDYAAQ
jgi:hypothetical protein